MYTTEEIDLVSEYLETDGADLLSFYNQPVKAFQQGIEDSKQYSQGYTSG